MSVRVCKFCEKEFVDGIDMVRSVKTGEWICMECFRERIQT